MRDRLHAALTGLVTHYRDRNPYVALERRLRLTQFDAPEVIAARQFTALRQIVRHAYDTVPLYRERYDALGFRPDDLRTAADFARLPVLTKADLRTQPLLLRSSAVSQADCIEKSTSGSTGVPLRVWVDRASIAWKSACTLRMDQWTGWRLGEPVAKIWGNPEYQKRGWRGYLRNFLIERAVYLDTLSITERSLAEFTAALHRTRPTMIFGHAHSVFLYAAHLRERGLSVPAPRGIITSAMMLYDWQRRVIEQAFGCKVTNRYGCEEVGIIACECDQHAGLHLNADNIFLEIDGPPGATTGPLLVTDLSNLAMPLIRYRLGDQGTLASGVCACGRGLPVLKELLGRESDYLVTPSGGRISGISLTENFIMEIPGVEQVQLVQKQRDRLTVRVVRGPGYGEASETRMTELLGKYFGPKLRHRVELVDKLAQDASGKYKFCICEVPTDAECGGRNAECETPALR